MADEAPDDPGRPISPDPRLPTYDNPGEVESELPPSLNPASTEPAQITVKLVLETKDGAAVRAESPEDLGTVRARQRARDVDDPYSSERQKLFGHTRTTIRDARRPAARL